jgi:hypothetical protein
LGRRTLYVFDKQRATHNGCVCCFRFAHVLAWQVEIHSHIIGRPDSFGVGFVANAIGASVEEYREVTR